MITLETPVVAVLGASKRAEKFTKGLGLATVEDLLRHFPRRYLETGRLTSVEDLHVGQFLTVIGEIASSSVVSYTDRRTGRRGSRVDSVLNTDGAVLRMSFFAKNSGSAHWRASTLAPGRQGLFLGQVSTFGGEWQLTHPRMLLFGPGPGDTEGADATDLAAVEAVGALYPIYPLTKGLESWDVHRAAQFALSVVEGLPELLPTDVRRRHRLVEVRAALAHLHTPSSYAEVEAGRRYFRFVEALVTQLVLGRRRRAQRAISSRSYDGGEATLAATFDTALPFTLTAGQRAVGAEIEADLARQHPMNRLLQGEVGSGKTLVALRAMLRVVDSGAQAALLAPTEVLAQQHHRSIRALLGDLAAGPLAGGTTVELLTGSMSRTQRTGPLSRMASGEAGIVVGTHALLEDAVQFAELGLVVVDEQHRFGVEQRSALTDKAASPPHVLVMTATPIPRTVAMTVFGDLEVSTLAELPAGRAAIQTTVVDTAIHPAWIDRVWQRVREEVAAGHQVYVVCPRITGDESEQGETDASAAGPDPDDEREVGPDPAPFTGEQPATAPRPTSLAAVEEVVSQLAAGPLADLRVRSLHGRQPPEDKDATMRAFTAGEVDVLVATTVIEVGVDVPNATTMVILDADRFGVSQLHQLRGRVGRGGLPGLCLLMTQTDPLSPARTRLDAVAATTDGFELSRIDLEQRREGDVLGRSQSGLRSTLTSLRVLRDEDTIIAARESAEDLLDADPDLTSAPLLAASVADLEARAEADFIEKS